MEHHYSRPRSGGAGTLLRFLGFIFAMILVIGMLDKAGLKITLEGREEKGPGPGYNQASMDEASPEERQHTETIYVSPDEPSRNHQDSYQPQPYREYSRQSPSRSARAGISPRDFIGRFAETAMAQALDKGVPAGISLALGVIKLEQGERIDSWQAFMEETVLPLARIKDNAYQQGLQAYFKYSANSGRWLEGLSRQGDYSYNALRQAMQKYHLARYDQEVRTALVDGTRVSPEMERKAGYVADEVSSNIFRQRVANEQKNGSASARSENVKEWQNHYDESVGREVAKEIARRKLNTGQYITEEDMGRLVDEANVETQKVLENNLSFLGREINPGHPDAAELKDITRPGNAQARQELYQKKLREQNYADNQ